MRSATAGTSDERHPPRLATVTDAELERLDQLLRVPSVSAIPEHGPDMARAAALVADEVRRAGGRSRCARPTGTRWCWARCPRAGETPARRA